MGVGDGGKPVAVLAQDVSVVFDGPVDDGSVSGEGYLAWSCGHWSRLRFGFRCWLFHD